MSTTPYFKKATVRIYGAFSEAEREKISQHDDRAGNLVVTIRDNSIEVAFDSSDHVYSIPIFTYSDIPRQGRT
jgi:hypothetical protein